MLYDPTRQWVHRGACRDLDPSTFFVAGSVQPNRTPTPAVQASWNEAKKICAGCPVLEACKRDTRGEEYGVWGGLDEHERYLLRGRLHRHAKKWAPGLRLAWGKELHRLRHGGVSWIEIRRLTGFYERLCRELIAEWEKHAAPKATALVVDLPLPEPEPLSFPPGRGDRDMWVRHNNLVASGYYQGQTSDGRWIRVQVKTGRGNAIKWVRAEDVRFHDPKPVMIVEYIGRPDRAEHEPTAKSA